MHSNYMQGHELVYSCYKISRQILILNASVGDIQLMQAIVMHIYSQFKGAARADKHQEVSIWNSGNVQSTRQPSRQSKHQSALMHATKCSNHAAQPTKGVICGSISNVGIGLVLYSLSVAHYRVNGTRLGWELAQPSAIAARGWVDSSSIGA